MSLITENGQGLVDAESYASVEYADSYHLKRGNTAWADLDNDAKEIALRQATDYIEQVYRLRWLGYRHTEAQALSYPRDEVQRTDFTYLNQYSFYPNDEVPREVKDACASLALRANTGELAPDLTQGVKREKIDSIEVEYDQYSTQYVRYRAIDNMLAPFLSGMGSGGQRRVIRT